MHAYDEKRITGFVQIRVSFVASNVLKMFKVLFDTSKLDIHEHLSTVVVCHFDLFTPNRHVTKQTVVGSWPETHFHIISDPVLFIQ